MPHSVDASTADIWGVRYIHFVVCVAGVAYAFLAVKNNRKAHLLDEVEAAWQAYWQAYKAAPANTKSERAKQNELWNKYLALSAEAAR